MEITLTLTENLHKEIKHHLFPGDAKESVAIIICGRRAGKNMHRLLAREIHPVPTEAYIERHPLRVTWKTDWLIPILEKAQKNHHAILKVHSHPGGQAYFSEVDDLADKLLFPSIHGWIDDDLPHGSAVLLPNGELIGRAALVNGQFQPINRITIVGNDLSYCDYSIDDTSTPDFALRTEQAFGKGTTSRLRKLSAAIIGCSGTGSIAVEQLARLGIGHLVLVDPDVIERKNLNRILNSTLTDADEGWNKAEMLSNAIKAMGLGTSVDVYKSNLYDSVNAIKAIAECDVVFGCMDSHEGRFLLNRIATYYLLPYFDVGVKLEADGEGGVNFVGGAVHYIQPGLSTLLSRKAITMAQVEAEGLKRTNPELYEENKKDKYIDGVNEESPAVISVNMLLAAFMVNEFIARIHPYRACPNKQFALIRYILTEGEQIIEGERDEWLKGISIKDVGRGDVSPLLGLPVLSDIKE